MLSGYKFARVVDVKEALIVPVLDARVVAIFPIGVSALGFLKFITLT